MRYEWNRKERSSMSVHDFIDLSQKAIDRGEPMLALDIANTGLDKHAGNLKLMQLASMGYVRSGSPARGAKILQDVFTEGQRDAETCGLLGSAFKRLWERTTDPNLKKLYGEHSTEYYRLGYESSESLYCVINCATMNILQNKLDEGKKFAQIAQSIAENELVNDSKNYWNLCSLAEAQLLQNDLENSKITYVKALEINGTPIASLIATRTQAMKIANHLGVAESLASTFDLGSVVFCSGHMIDHPLRKIKRFPPDLEFKVKIFIKDILISINAQWGYSSAACGTDIIFLECLQELGAETNIILPFEKEDFLKTSVEYAGSDWIKRFENVLNKADNIYQTTETGFLGDEFLFAHCNDFMRGMATTRARILGGKPNLIAVWDGKQHESIGGTAEFLESCDKEATMIHHIDLHKYVSQLSKKTMTAEDYADATKVEQNYSEGERKLKTIIFADFDGFSALTEKQTPLFVEHCMTPIGEYLNQSDYKIDFVNTWGDGLFIVLDSVVDGADLALDLRDMIVNMKFEDKGLPKQLGIRIAMHIGPVFEMNDPIKNEPNFFGTHVFKAARMEPITTPGCVYCTIEIAALIAIKNPNLITEYVGNLPLAKSFGTYPIYQLRRLGHIE